MLGAIALPLSGAITEVVGSFSQWPEVWEAVTGVTDPVGDFGDSGLDFAGDALDPVAYWSSDANYVFVRFRLARDPISAVSDFDGESFFSFIDVVGVGPEDYPDFSFSYDGQQGHGLELSVITNTTYTIWDDVRVSDFDGNSGQKLETDINGGERTTDGYIRAVDGQTTTYLGTTTFFEIAISWDYLTGFATGLEPGQTWRFAFGSLAAANEHQGPGADMVGDNNLGFSVSQGWSDPITPVPEPSILVLLLASIAGFGLWQRRL